MNDLAKIAVLLEIVNKNFPEVTRLLSKSDEFVEAVQGFSKADNTRLTRKEAGRLRETLKTAGLSDDVIEGGSNTIAKYGDDFGRMGTYVENPQIKVDWSQYAEHAAERMQQRGMTQELIDDIVNNGKVLSQNGGNKFAYITQYGVAIVSKNGKLITAWGKSNFDENMLDVISKLFGE